MKYFSPSYWFKMWVLSAPLFSNKNQNVNAKFINEDNFKDEFSKNSTDIDMLSNQQLSNNNMEFYEKYLQLQELKPNIHKDKHRHERSRNRNRHKRQHSTISNSSSIIKDLDEINTTTLSNIENVTDSTDLVSNNIETTTDLQNTLNQSSNIITIPTILEVNSDPISGMIFFSNIVHLLLPELRERNILIRLLNSDGSFVNEGTEYYVNPQPPVEYFMIQVNVETTSPTNNNLRLFYRSSDLYLEGFIPADGNQYRYFSDSTLRDPSIDGITPYQLPFSGNYNALNPATTYSWNTVFNNFEGLALSQSNPNAIRRAAVGVILATSESWRFYDIRNAFLTSINIPRMNSENFVTRFIGEPFTIEAFSNPLSRTPNLDETWSYYNSIITNWNLYTRRAISYFDDQPNRNFNNYFNYRRDNNEPIVNVFRHTMSTTQQCNFNSMLKRDYIKEKHENGICHSNNVQKPKGITIFLDKNKILNNLQWNSGKISSFPDLGEIKDVIVSDINNNISNLKKGLIFVLTNQELRIMQPSLKSKTGLTSIDFAFDQIENGIMINSISRAFNNYFVTTSDKKIYNLVGQGENNYWIQAQEITNSESSDLNKELKLYYHSNKADKELHLAPEGSHIRSSYLQTWNLGKINPIDNFQKMKFIGKTEDDKGCWGTTLKWGSYDSICWDFTNICEVSKCYKKTLTGKSIKKYFGDNENSYNNIIKNYKVNLDSSTSEICEKYTPEILQNIDETYDSAHVYGSNSFGLNFFWEENNYFLQAAFCQYADWRASLSSLDNWFKIGNGIKFYNENSDIFCQKNPNHIQFTPNITEEINNSNISEPSFDVNEINTAPLPSLTNDNTTIQPLL